MKSRSRLATPVRISKPCRRRRIISGSDDEDSRPLLKRRAPSHLSQGNKRSSQSKMLSEVQKSNKLLASLLQRVNDNEKRLQAIEEKVTSSIDSTSSRRKQTKRDVPDEVRVSK